jgi:hypothetical protein
MEDLLELLEFLYYSFIFFTIILFFSIIIDISISKLFPPDNNNYIILEIFVIWISLSILLYFSKKIIYNLPNPFTKTKILNNDLNIMMIITLVPLIVGVSVFNMKNKTNILYTNINNLLFNF